MKRVVLIGGGRGLYRVIRAFGLLYGFKNLGRLTAICAVTDPGKKMLAWRRSTGTISIGDLVRTLCAGIPNELIVKALVTRVGPPFTAESQKLSDHYFGHLLIQYQFDFRKALRDFRQSFGISLQAFPVTTDDTWLVLHGQERVDVIYEIPDNIEELVAGMERLGLEPENPAAFPEALKAIRQAQWILLGPGSFYSSVLAPLLTPKIKQAVLASKARKLYICNLATEQMETNGWTVEKHLDQLLLHTGPKKVNYSEIIVDTCLVGQETLLKDEPYYDPTEKRTIGLSESLTTQASSYRGIKIIRADQADLNDPYRHDPRKLAEVFKSLLS